MVKKSKGLPTSVLDYGVNVRHGNTILLSQSLQCNRTSHVFGTDSGNLLRRQFGTAVSLAMMMASLLSHVGKVLGLGAKKQMIRANTRRIIALVADTHTQRDRSISQFPGNNMGSPDPVGRVDMAVSMSEMSAHPKPAVARLIHFGPESLFKRSPFTRIDTLGHFAPPTRSEDSPGRLLCRQEALAGLIRPHPDKPIIPQMGVA